MGVNPRIWGCPRVPEIFTNRTPGNVNREPKSGLVESSGLGHCLGRRTGPHVEISQFSQFFVCYPTDTGVVPGVQAFFDKRALGDVHRKPRSGLVGSDVA